MKKTASIAIFIAIFLPWVAFSAPTSTIVRNLFITGQGGAGTKCLHISNSGFVSTSTADCGTSNVATTTINNAPSPFTFASTTDIIVSSTASLFEYWLNPASTQLGLYMQKSLNGSDVASTSAAINNWTQIANQFIEIGSSTAGMASSSPNFPLTFASTTGTSGLAIYGTQDQVTNVSRLAMGYTGSSPYLSVQTQGSGSLQTLSLAASTGANQTIGNHRLVISNGSPAVKVSVGGTDGNQVIFDVGIAGAGGLGSATAVQRFIEIDGPVAQSGTAGLVALSVVPVITSRGSGQYQLLRVSNSTATTTPFVVLDNGTSTAPLVGIGTSTPADPLDIASSSGSNMFQFKTNGGVVFTPQGNNVIYQLNDANSTNAIWSTNIGVVTGGGGVQGIASASTGNLSLFTGATRNSLTTGTARLTANGTTGNVGIATTTPSETLTVNGGFALQSSSSTITTAAIGGAIVSGGCDSATSTIDSSLSTSTTSFITSPSGNPGTTLGGTWVYSYISSAGVLTTNVCSNVSVTPNTIQYVVKIVR